MDGSVIGIAHISSMCSSRSADISQTNGYSPPAVATISWATFLACIMMAVGCSYMYIDRYVYL